MNQPPTNIPTDSQCNSNHDVTWKEEIQTAGTGIMSNVFKKDRSTIIDSEMKSEHSGLQSYLESEEEEVWSEHSHDPANDTEGINTAGELEVSNDADPHSCPLCEFLSLEREDVIKHYRLVHEAADRKFKCDICGNNYRLKHHLNRHIISRHRKELVEGQIEATFKVYKCTFCSYETTNSTQFANHMLTHGLNVRNLKQLKCNKCDYETYKASQLKRHVKSHSRVKPFPCTSCDQGFYLQNHLDFHVLTYHSSFVKEEPPKKEYACPTCIYKTENVRAFLRHKWIHKKVTSETKSKPETLRKCRICDFKSLNKNTLAAHVRRRHFVKPFLCTACEKGYRTKVLFDTHILIHHRFEDNFLKLMTNTVQECNNCAYMCMNHTTLRNHMRRVHAKKL